MLKKSSRIFGHKAEEKIQEKYKSKSEFIQNKLALRGKKAPSTDKKKVLRKELKALNEKINSEIKTQIKQAFHYEIPIAEVEKAGISTTGAKIDNELENLWQKNLLSIANKINYGKKNLMPFLMILMIKVFCIERS